MKKRILSLLLTLAMLSSLLTCLPTTASAAEGDAVQWIFTDSPDDPENYTGENSGSSNDIKDAFLASYGKTGDNFDETQKIHEGEYLHIKLNDNVTTSQGFSISNGWTIKLAGIVIDLAGHTLTCTDNQGWSFDCAVTIKNGSFDFSQSKLAVYTFATNKTKAALNFVNMATVKYNYLQAGADTYESFAYGTISIEAEEIICDGNLNNIVATDVTIKAPAGKVATMSIATMSNYPLGGDQYSAYYDYNGAVIRLDGEVPASYTLENVVGTIAGSYGVFRRSGSGTTVKIIAPDGYSVKLSENFDGSNAVDAVIGENYYLDSSYDPQAVKYLVITPACEHSYTYTPIANAKGYHTGSCGKCGDGISREACSYGDDTVCDKCGYESAETKWGFGVPGIENFTNFTGSGNLNAAIAAANGNADTTNTVTYIQLQKDLEHESYGYGLFTINQDRTAVLDLNNKKITVNDYGNLSNKSIINITVKGDLTLKNGTITITNEKALSKNYIGIDVDPDNAKALNIDNCTITVNTPKSPKQTLGIMCGDNRGTTQAVVTVTNSTINVNAKDALGVFAHSNLVVKLSDSTVTATNVDNGTQDGYAVYAIKTKVYLSGNTKLSGTNAGLYLPYFESSIYAHDGAAQNPKPFTGNDIIVDGEFYTSSVGEIVIYDVTDANIGKFKLHENKTEITLKKNGDDLVLAKKVARIPVTAIDFDFNWDNMVSIEDSANSSYAFSGDFVISNPAGVFESPAVMGMWWVYNPSLESEGLDWQALSAYEGELTDDTRIAVMFGVLEKAEYTIQGLTADKITYKGNPIVRAQIDPVDDGSDIYGAIVLVEVGTKKEVDEKFGITPDAPEAGTIESIQEIVAVDATNKTVTVTPKAGEENYIYYSIVIPTAALAGSTMTPEQYVAMVMGGVGKSIPDVTGYDLTSTETVATLNTLTMAGQTYVTNISASNKLEWTLESSSVVIVYKLLAENSKSQTYSSPSSNPFFPSQPNTYAYGIYGAYATIVEIAGGDTTEPTFDSAEFAFTYADTIGKIVVGEALPDLSSLTNTIVIKDTAGNIIPATVELEWLAQGGEEGWGWADSNAQEGVEYGIRVGVNAEGYLFDNTAATFTCTDDKLTISVVWPGDNGFAAVVAAKKEPVIEDPTVTAPDHNNGDVTVGGLKDEAEKVADEVAAANPGADITVSVDMTVDVQASDVVKQTEKTAIEEIAASQSKNLEYLDIIIEKTVTINNGTPTTDPINKTNGLVTITINFPTDGKTDFKIYRYHDKHSTEHTGNVQVLTTTPNSHGEYIAVGNGQITIYAKYFSTYAIGYTTASTPVSYTVTVTNGTGDGEYEAGATVTITADAAPSGKVFDKWIVSGAFPANANNAITTFTMPDHDVTVVATYKDDANDRYDDWYWTMLLLYSKKYDITATATGGGEIDPAGVTKVQYSKSITYTITPDAGYAIKSVLVDGKDVGAVNTYTFKNVTKKHTIHAIFEAVNPYTDVKANDWFYEDVLFVTAKSLMNGTGNGKFSPEITTDRAMLVTVLWRLEGSPVVDSSVDFTDVVDGQWYSEAIDWASANGIVNGYGNGKFGPTDQITREQIMAILNRYAAYKNWTDGIALPMLPQYNCSIWAENNVIWADMSGLLDNLGVDVYDMTAKASRAELAAYLSRFMKNIAK